MADDVLFNAILFHELGHHVFEENASSLPFFSTDLRNELEQVYQDKLPHFASATEEEQKQYLGRTVEIVRSWISEIYSDIVATSIVGPQFCFACSDLFTLTQRIVGLKQFTQSHPAPLVRASQQYYALTEVGWMVIPKEILPGSAFNDLAHQVFSKLEPGPFPENNDDWNLGYVGVGKATGGFMIDAFMKRITKVRAHAIAQVRDAQSRSKEFWYLGDAVADALNRAVVPSTIVSAQPPPKDGLKGVPTNGDQAFFRYHPQPCTVMNVARVLYQDGCSELLKRWTQNRLATYDETLHVHRRVSQWVHKAIGDWLLVSSAG